ncbi:hypothetical protein GO004_06850 [Bacillus subtilis]|nr:hypothetical protein GO004_06850 [Bacillus subtilis]
MEIHVTYNTTLICLSFLIACTASYISLELSRKVTINKGLKSKIWLIGGSLIMGFGIWSMHFVGMMAVHKKCRWNMNSCLYWQPLAHLFRDHLCHYILSAGTFLHITDCLPDQLCLAHLLLLCTISECLPFPG